MADYPLTRLRADSKFEPVSEQVKLNFTASMEPLIRIFGGNSDTFMGVMVHYPLTLEEAQAIETTFYNENKENDFNLTWAGKTYTEIKFFGRPILKPHDEMYWRVESKLVGKE